MARTKILINFEYFKDRAPSAKDHVLVLWMDESKQWHMKDMIYDGQTLKPFTQWTMFPTKQIEQDNWPHSGPLRLAQKGDQ